MKRRFLLFGVLLTACVFIQASFSQRHDDTESFKEKQLRYEKVREAYRDKASFINDLLEKNGLESSDFELLILAYKHEAILEAWGRPFKKQDDAFVLLRSFDICASSGDLGPKRKEGDLQVPEGFYHISYFNPVSDYYTSLGVSYPNESDKILSDKKRPGGSIAIHGDCVTLGCLPITDDKMKELYVLAVEARNNGQVKIPIYIFPFRMTSENFKKAASESSPETVKFWENIKEMYDYFEKNKSITYVGCDRAGKYIFE